VSRLPGQGILSAFLFLVEPGSPSDKLLDSSRPFFDQDLHSLRLAQTLARTKGVFPVHGDVLLFGGHGHAALGVDRTPFGRTPFGKDEDATGSA
jgi:hypothetical protein